MSHLYSKKKSSLILILLVISVILTVKVAYIVSAEDEKHVLLNGNGVTLRGDRLFNFVPKEGEISLMVDGMNIKGELMVFKNK